MRAAAACLALLSLCGPGSNEENGVTSPWWVVGLSTSINMVKITPTSMGTGLAPMWLCNFSS